jgi:hypothetical protein
MIIPQNQKEKRWDFYKIQDQSFKVIKWIYENGKYPDQKSTKWCRYITKNQIFR